MRERRPRAAAWIGHGHAVLEREPAVAGDVVGVRVRLEDARSTRTRVSRGLGEELLDREGRVDDDRDRRRLVADEVRGAAEVVVDELLEQHNSDASNQCGCTS